MEVGFDKEIDAILRKARGAEVVTSAGPHLGADDISAFAENALPDAARQRSAAHLADCTRCRKILSNVIALNSEAETETASSLVPAKIAAVKTPWYRKLFVFPQIAYAMGALVLLFSGFFGYLALQTLNSANKDVSFSANKPAQMEKSAPQAAPTISSTSNAATAATNSSALAANTSVTTSATPNPASNTATANASTERKSAEPELSLPITKTPTAPVASDDIKVDKDGEDDKTLAKLRTENEVNKPSAASGATQPDSRSRDKSKKETYSREDQPTDEVAEEKPKPNSPVPAPKKQTSEAGKTRSVGGKTFNNVGGIWFDSAYSNQKQKTVTRGTNDYQKLDSGLRSIADQFSGTVVVLWKSKAYRIQ